MRDLDKTLEQIIDEESNNLLTRIANADANVLKMQGRLEAAVQAYAPESEIKRLTDLVALHTNYRASLNGADVNALAQARFDRMQERKARYERPVIQ